MDQHESLAKTYHIGNRLKELPEVFASCYQHWSCSPAVIESAKETFNQQKETISLLNTRMWREEQANELTDSLLKHSSYYTGPSNRETLRDWSEQESSLTTLLAKEKNLAQTVQKFKDPDSQKALFSKKQKGALAKYYEIQKDNLKKLAAQLAQNGNSEERAKETKFEL